MTTAASPHAEFFTAIKQRDYARVRDWLSRDPAPLTAFDPDSFGAPPLNIAVSRGDIEMIELLLEAGADPDLKSDWWAGGFAALHTIPPDSKDDIAPRLIEAGATVDAHAAAYLGDLRVLKQRITEDPAVVGARGGDGRMPLHFATTPEVARLLLDHGADIEARDVDHESTPVMWAAAAHPKVAQVLLDAGAKGDVFLYSAIGDTTRLATALDEAPGAGRWIIDATRFPTSKKEVTAIYAFTLGWESTPLQVAARCNQADVIRLFAARGTDLSFRAGYDHSTALHIAAWEGAVEAGHALIHAGAPLDIVSGREHENEPIGWAIVSGKVAMVKLLLSHGAAVREHHVRQARAGVTGEFEGWSRSTHEDWVEIEAMIAERTAGG